MWLKVAECYENLGEVHNSIEAYYQVISLAPLHASVRLTLANALRSVGRNEDAITVLAGNFWYFLNGLVHGLIMITSLLLSILLLFTQDSLVSSKQYCYQ